MGSGKSTVGRELAERLGWRFRDFDDVVEERAGATVEEIFARRGEAAFRELEARVALDLLEAEEIVLATGGGWPAATGRLESVPPGSLVVLLRVSAATAVARTASSARVRPLLQGPDPIGEARRLLDQREPYYSGAAISFDSEALDPEAIVDGIVDVMRITTRTGTSRRTGGLDSME